MPSVLGNLSAFPENIDVREVELSHVDAHKQGGVLPVTGIAPALAKGITGIEPASEAEKAIVTRPEALVS